MLTDLGKGQLTHTSPDAFAVGRNMATTPGKVIHRTRLFELIQYSPTTETVLETPLVIFPPWINRFYILDLSPEKSFIRWAVDQGLTVFMVSWKSADASMADVTWDDYVLAQVEAIEVACDQLGVEATHAIGYCVAGTTLAATLAYLTARGDAAKVRSATFFTAQVDFTAAGDLLNFVDDAQLDMIRQLSPEGYLDGRYMAATFNLLRGRDLIWNYVANNYLLGKDYAPFDLLHWNGDTTNLPAKWHLSYLTDLYRDNLLVRPGALAIAGTPIDLTTIKTPSYVQAGREDHIAPAESVWKITELFTGPLRFVLAGSGHIAGVVNPPSAQKYQYWVNEKPAATLAEFMAGATETKGSWWPDWIDWLRNQDDATVAVKGARKPGGGKKRAALGDAPGTYVTMR
jgi:polyhydroxyalkanoate synthase subunit PhaC